MSTDFKAWIQVIAWLATGVGAAVALIKFAADNKAGRLQRERDLRWKQAEAGKKLNDEMLTDSEACAAMSMLDYSGRTFTLPSGAKTTITTAMVADALDPETPVESETQIFIRDAFDSLFYYMAMLEHYTARGLILAEDVAHPSEYYIPLLAQYGRQVFGYLAKYRLNQTVAFLERFGFSTGEDSSSKLLASSSAG